MKTVPSSLRTWFKIHFLIDIIIAIPLILSPYLILDLLGFYVESPLTARLVGAALLGIGGASFAMHNKGIESYNSMLTLKIIWSLAAQVAIFLTILEGAPQTAWIIFAIFAAFSVIWIRYKAILN
jgi:hypothetical protein